MTEANEPVLTEMADGRKIQFGKKTAAYNVEEDGNGLTIKGAFVDGNYAEHTVGSVEELHAFAAYGLKAFARAAALKSAEGFKALNWANPNAIVARKSKGRKAEPLEAALVSVTGKTLEAIRAFLAGKSKKERAALAKDPRVAPVLASLKAKPAEDGGDLLGGLVDPVESNDVPDEASA